MLYEVECNLVEGKWTEIVEADSREEAIDIFHARSNEYLEFVDHDSSLLKGERIMAYRAHILGNYKHLRIKEDNIQELFEILCDIPFEVTRLDDMEPRANRPDSVESLIDQLAPYYDMGEFT